MTDDISDFFVHTATVETFAGSGAYGDVYNAPVVLDPADDNGCYIEGARHLVRDKDGAQVVSETQLYTARSNEALFAPDSRVTFNGGTSLVITVSTFDSGDLDLPDHICVALT